MAKSKEITVILRQHGAIACGQYQANKAYKVTEEEAARLTSVKGFELVKDKNDAAS